eukprot:TRINITY_DN102508_c0_g1_i1.p1 TRINITY_DN102508_c0_g1~~TRINITY_DN102508_c0_g1_i1.p1  ORF type:complete len:442 (-),score=64.39 TRINITY_DN102508_c0_g1_i1:191-1465(-)
MSGPTTPEDSVKVGPHVLQFGELLFEHGDSKDVCLECSDGIVWTHSTVLRALSQPLDAMLKANMKEALSGSISLPDYSCAALRFWLRLLYTGQVSNSDWCDQCEHVAKQEHKESLMVAGASGASATIINGSYQKTGELLQGEAVYKKSGGKPDLWLAHMEKRWYMTSTYRKERCFPGGWLRSFAEADGPLEGVKAWQVWDSQKEKWVVQPEIKVFQPKVVIAGAVGPHAGVINGSYEQNRNTPCGRPIFWKQGEDTTSLKFRNDRRWYVYTTPSGNNSSGACLCSYDLDAQTPNTVAAWSEKMEHGWRSQPSVRLVHGCSCDPLPPLDLVLAGMALTEKYLVDHLRAFMVSVVCDRLSVVSFQDVLAFAIKIDHSPLRLHCLRFAENNEDVRKVFLDGGFTEHPVNFELMRLWPGPRSVKRRFL